MNQLVLHHHYTFGSTFDVSNFGNHGLPQLVTAGTAAFSSALHFQASGSRVTVAPSKSLTNPFAVQAMVRFYVEGSLATARHNLIEGFVSFALYLEPTGVLTGTIVDNSGAWRGASSPANLVTPNTWHEAWLSHDGISTIELMLDGVVVARADNVIGPVNSVGNLGVAVGNWPDAGAYPFAGYIDEVKLYRYNPADDLRSLMDPCCFDGKAFDTILGELKQNPIVGTGKPGATQILALLVRIGGLLRNGDSVRTLMVTQLGQGILRALKNRDIQALGDLHTQIEKLAGTPPGAKGITELWKELQSLATEARISGDLMTRLAAALCLRFPAAIDIKPREAS